MKYLLSLLLLCAVTCLPLMATPLDDLKHIAASAKHLSGQFEQSKYIAQLETHLNSRGDFSYQADKQIIVWHTMSPIDSTLTLTPGKIVSQQNGHTVNSMSASQSPVVAIFSDIFFGVMTANWQLLGQYFDIAPQVNGEKWQATLTPNDAQITHAVSKVVLTGDPQLKKILMLEPNGNQITITFFNLTSNIETP